MLFVMGAKEIIIRLVVDLCCCDMGLHDSMASIGAGGGGGGIV